ncbi:MAG: hypothetical protein H0U49_02590 [Parachlamydiaceae bacterium]|nr:hypothetical protein [Parachlamydiaceae bacterium]
MTISGAGPGGVPGNTPPPTIREQETTASTVAAKAGMHIVMDTLLIPMLLVDQESRKYSSSSNRPVLAPLSTSRGAASYPAPSDESWKLVYHELTDKLPIAFRALFESAMWLPVDERNPNITKGDGALQTFSKLLTLLRNAATPLNPESLEGLRASDNIFRPYIALNAMVFACEQLLIGAQAYLAMVGANDPHFDIIANALGEFTVITEDITSAAKLLTNSSTENQGKELLASAHDQIVTLSDQFDRVGAGGEFLVLGHTLHAAELATAALLLGNLGTAALLFGLSNATYGLEKGTSFLGLVGPSYSAFTQSISEGISSIYLGDVNAGQEMIFKTLLDTTLLTTLLLASIMYDGNTQKVQKDLTPAEVSEINFSHELTVDFLASSGMLSEIGNLIAKESGASETKQASMAALIETSLMLLLIAPSIKGGDFDSIGPLLNGITDKLTGSLAKGMQGLKGSETISQALKVALQQLEIALNNKDLGALQNALKKSLELTTATTEGFIADLKDLKHTAHTTSDNLDVSANNTATTHITQAA